ncbi:hypothetical protein [Endozoicomonas numazuensis]|nr:hypothetical protein [Endozoicomonas numazuensis]
MVKISYEHFPEETQKVLNGLTASGEAVDAVVDFADKATGRAVSKKWISLDQATRDELAGYGKIFSVAVPAAKVRKLTDFSKKQFTPSQERAIRGLEEQIAKHEKKLKDFKANPDKYDNKEFLKNAEPELREKIIKSRVRSLEKQIETFNRDVEAIKKGDKDVLERSRNGN